MPPPVEPAGEDPVSSSLPPLPEPSVSMELLRRHQAGDEGALDSLLSRYLGRVERVVRAQLGAGLARRLEYEDVVQETFRQTLAALDTFAPRDESSLIRLFAQRAIRVIRDEARWLTRRKRDTRREVELDPHDSHTHPVAPRAGPPEDVSQREQAQRIDEIVHGLEPAELREVFIQRVYLGRAWDEIRRDLGLSSRSATERLFIRAKTEVVAAMTSGDGRG